MGRRLASVAWALSLAIVAASVVAVVVFVVGTIGVRVPYWGEAEPVFEASRVRAGLPLFIDPLVGAHEYGEPPSRFFVTYPPIWSLLLACVPARAALVVGRVAATSAWAFALAFPVMRARRDRRVDAAACAAFVGGTWVLANFATIARPDALACAIASFALVRATERGRVGPLEATLFVLVPLVKPTVLGLPAGALVADAIVRRRPATLAFAAVVAAAAAVALHVASGGALFAHVARSNAQPMTLAAWLDHVPSRLPFFAPLFALAAYDGFRDRASRGTAIGLGAFACAIAWVLVALAKTGSASNYWMEPCVAAVVVVARAAPGAFRIARGGVAQAAATLACVAYADVASIRASFEHLAAERADARIVASIPARCGARDGDLVAADEAGVELLLDGRILAPAYQTAWLVHGGRFPAATWISDLSSARVRCFVLRSGDLAPAPEIERAVARSFAPRFEERGFRVLAKPSP